MKNLGEEMEKLRKFRDDIKEKVEGADGEGYKQKRDVLKWLKDVQKLEGEWESMQGSIAAAKTHAYKCCPKCSLRSEVSAQARNILDQLCELKKMGENFGSSLLVENYQVKKVEFIPGPSIEGQSAAARNINEILQLLEDDKVCIIGVWGMGGVGKTTLVKNLNNELLKIAASSSKLSFGVVIWVTVPKPPTDIRKVQAQIANRLSLKVDSEESVETIASRIHQRLKEVMRFLLILDDVWEAINLDHIGVPQPEDSPRSKVIITSRFLNVCRQMRTDAEMKVYTFDEDESWQLFVKNARDNANLEHIQPFAKKIAKQCDGLPLAITVIAASMRGQERVELWKGALESLRMSKPNKDFENMVYKVIKWSFDSLESQGIELSSEQTSKHVNKRGEGLLGEHDTYEEAYNRGITVIESLKDACLLETHGGLDSVKMHAMVRNVAIWIANSLGDEHNSLIQAGIGLTHIKIMSVSVKRISFVSNKIERLPDSFKKCPKTTTLLLQDNSPLQIIPHELFQAFPALRVLNLSGTGIRALPSSINSLSQLNALILQNCGWLTELPPIGDLCNLQLLDCDNTKLNCLPQGLDKLTNLRLLNMPATYLKSIGQGILPKLSSIEMLNMLDTTYFQPPRWYLTPHPYPGTLSNVRKEGDTLLGSSTFDELSYLPNLTSLFVKLDSSSILNRDHTWMSRLERFRIEVGVGPMEAKFNKSTRMIGVSQCQIFSKGELSGMLQFASDLYLIKCMGLRKLIAYNSFDGLKSLHIVNCSCDFKPVEEGNEHFDPLPNLKEGNEHFDPLPNLEYLRLGSLFNLKSVSEFGHFLGTRFSKLRQLEMAVCQSLTCLFNVGGAFSVPKHLEDIGISNCRMTLVNSEVPRVRELLLENCPSLGTLGEPENTWEHLEELSLTNCNQIRKLPLSIQTSKNIKVIRGASDWWSQLEWDDDSSKSKLEHCFLPL
ncbi:disease resistance protein At4g27190-like isoform X2 [Nicotiana tomentosiformis]|uniref:disease resistance protein At4g27190-like isoform X2 n=1 Tax=Nicotiana tomentosiformis TaxID=4098 RepID=UPI00087857D7|nr:disease resistance protein At4g27190-like isoform X2 [Nicotiana tomentosiformis]